MSLSECPQCGGVLACAASCDGPNATAREEFVTPPRTNPTGPSPRTRTRRPGLPRLRARINELQRLHPDWNVTRLADAVGLHSRTVRRWLEGSVPLGPIGRPTGPSRPVARALSLLQLYPDRDVDEVAHVVGVAPNTVRRWLRKQRKEAAPP